MMIPARTLLLALSLALSTTACAVEDAPEDDTAGDESLEPIAQEPNWGDGDGIADDASDPRFLTLLGAWRAIDGQVGDDEVGLEELEFDSTYEDRRCWRITRVRVDCKVKLWAADDDGGGYFYYRIAQAYYRRGVAPVQDKWTSLRLFQ